MAEPLTDGELDKVRNSAHLTPGEVEELLRSPRLNERSRFLYVGPTLSRWDQFRIIVVAFAAVVIFGFWYVPHAATVAREERAKEQCNLLEDNRAGIRLLVDRIVETSPSSSDRSRRLPGLVAEVLPAVAWHDGKCQEVP